MPKRKPDHSPELARLIAEQQRDRGGRHVFPERIHPRRPVLFASLTPRLRAAFILSILMKRREVARAMFLTPASVSIYLKRARKKLTPEDLSRYQNILRLR